MSDILKAYAFATLADREFGKAGEAFDGNTVVSVTGLDDIRWYLQKCVNSIEIAREEAPTEQLAREVGELLEVASFVRDRIREMSVTEPINRERQPARVVRVIARYIAEKFNPKAVAYEEVVAP